MKHKELELSMEHNDFIRTGDDPLRRQAQHGKREIARPCRPRYSGPANGSVLIALKGSNGQRTQRLSHTSEHTTPPLL